MARVDGSSRGSREAHWRGLMKSCESSGKTIVGYCREQGVSVSKYHWWKSELKRRDGEPVSVPVFAEVRGAHSTEGTVSGTGAGPSDVPGAGAGGFCCAPLLIELSLGGARRIGVRPGFDAETLSRLLSLVERLGSAGGA
jgi:hypothetical protein